MGIVLKKTMINKQLIDKSICPIIFCTDEVFAEKYTQNHFRVDLNRLLAKELIKHEKLKRNALVYDFSVEIIANAGNKILLLNYEMLFSPQYQIDPIKLMIELSRKQRIVAIWCGNEENLKLTYSEIGLADYYTCSIADKDITCII